MMIICEDIFFFSTWCNPKLITLNVFFSMSLSEYAEIWFFLYFVLSAWKSMIWKRLVFFHISKSFTCFVFNIILAIKWSLFCHISRMSKYANQFIRTLSLTFSFFFFVLTFQIDFSFFFFFNWLCVTHSFTWYLIIERN